MQNNHSMTQAQLLQILRHEQPYLITTFGVKRLGIFGS